MEYKKHCSECEKKLGKDWAVVHRWLDHFAKTMGVPGHRSVRHHKAGVEKVRAKWGDEAARAAELHIISDFGFVPTEEEVLRLLKGFKKDCKNEHRKKRR